MTELVLYFICTVVVSMLCSMMEAVILSITPGYISILEKSGRKAGRLLRALHTHIDQPLAAILTLNTIANTFGASLAAHAATKVYGDNYLALFSWILTFTILVFSEIIPKTIGSIYAKEFAPLAAHTVSIMVKILSPLLFVTRIISELITKGSKKKFSREEMIATAELSADEGVIHKKEGKIIKNLLQLDTVKVVDIMTPSSVVNAFEMNETVGSIMDKYKPVRFSRIPLYEGSPDNIKGLLHRYRLMEAVSHDMYNMPLKDIMSSIHRVPESTSVSSALDQFIKRREHLFLVHDESMRVTGIVTLEDAIETLLGVEIVDEYDTVTDMRQYAMDQLRLKKQALNYGQKTGK